MIARFEYYLQLAELFIAETGSCRTVLRRYDGDRQNNLEWLEANGAAISGNPFDLSLGFVASRVRTGCFSTADEKVWLARSFQFLEALTRGDWAASMDLRWGEPAHPGVTTRWTGALGIMVHFLPQLAVTPDGIQVEGRPLGEVFRPSLELLAAARWPTVLVASLAVSLLFLLCRSWAGVPCALLIAAFLALDPFYLALSRVLHHDALDATFALISVIAFLQGLRCDHWPWFVISGVVAGLAFLSKSLALVLLPLAVLLAVFAYVQYRLRISVAHLALFCVVFVMTVFAGWPSMWVHPIQALRAVFDTAIQYSNSPHELGNFFWGQRCTDPGPLFYPVAIIFRQMPLVTIGTLISGPALLLLRRERTQAAHDLSFLLMSMWAVAIAFVALLTMGAKKFDRYALPAMLALDVAAAITLAVSLKACRRWGRYSTYLGRIVFGSAFLAQTAVGLGHYPYYFSYYNPLVGGGQIAPQVMLVGWGEGFDKVARYCGTISEKGKVSVGTIYAGMIEYLEHFKGYFFDFPTYGPATKPQYPWAQLDYVVLYISARQRYTVPKAFDELTQQIEPGLTVTIAGISYASVYKIPKELFLSLPVQAKAINARYEQGITLVGLRVHPLEKNSARGEQLPVTLYWQVQSPCINTQRVAIRGFQGANQVVATGEAYAPWGPKKCRTWPLFWRSDLIFPDQIDLRVTSIQPAEALMLEVRLLDDATGLEIEPMGKKPALSGPFQLLASKP